MRKLQEIREQKAITQKELAAMTGLSQITITRIETGHQKAAARTRKKIAQALRMRPQDIDFG